MKIHPLIDNNDDLSELCGRLAKGDFVAVDTEFMRENSYYPYLCLIQIGNESEAAAIDPLAKGLDLSPLLELLMDNHDVIKVFHAGSQDMEIFYNLSGTTPFPLFDTQIAAMALGPSEQIGYAAMVESWLGVKVDKGARFTDWSRRPLDRRQLDYAIGDVTYLSQIFPQMLDRLRDTGRGLWLDEEMETLADPENYRVDFDQLWRRIRTSSRKPEVLGRLRALASWREEEAQSKNIPRGRVIKDETLAEIANHPPDSQAGLGRIRGLSAAWKNNDIGARLMDRLIAARPLEKHEMPPKKSRGPSLGKDGALVSDLLKLLLKIRAREINVAQRLIARSDDLEKLAAGVRDDLPLLKGWRYEQFGRDALELIEGRLAFTIVEGTLTMTRIDRALTPAETGTAGDSA